VKIFFKPPSYKSKIIGEKVDFPQLCLLAGIKIRSSGAYPDIFIHSNPDDFYVMGFGQTSYCLSDVDIPSADPDRSRTIMEKLAYQFLEWHAREAMAAHHRHEKRESQRSIPQTEIMAAAS
jgi:hypothetical protein